MIGSDLPARLLEWVMTPVRRLAERLNREQARRDAEILRGIQEASRGDWKPQELKESPWEETGELPTSKKKTAAVETQLSLADIDTEQSA